MSTAREVGMDVYLPDSTALVRGGLKELVLRGEIRGRVIIHTKLLDYFEKLAHEGKSLGYIGITELREVLDLISKFGLSDEVAIEFTREVPSGYRVFSLEDVDSLIRELARDWDAVVITCDEVKKQVCEASGIRCIYVERRVKEKLSFEDLFDSETMSIHLKEGVPPTAKKGRPGMWYLVQVGEKPLTRNDIENIVREILEYCRESKRGDAFIEVERPNTTIVQYRNYRIIIVKPPTADGYEVTIVRPIIKKRLEDYNLPEKLIRRLEKQAEGILIAGPPGAGKTTFAQALAEFYLRKGRIVKTIEAPRDMILPPEITQYSKAFATSEELHDVLLLSRPDYTIFDEMRDTKDFELFKDLRLAGVGMVGVVHATSPIDAIQRFIGRVELGMIPSIIDTVIFMKNGEVTKVYSLELVVKIPTGLREEDLARPVVVVKDFLTEEPEYEIYVFGEQTFVVPVRRLQIERGLRKVISRAKKIISKYVAPENIDIEVIDESTINIYVPDRHYDIVNARCRKKLEALSSKYGVRIRVVPR